MKPIDWKKTSALLPQKPTVESTKELQHHLFHRGDDHQHKVNDWIHGPGFWISSDTKVLFMIERDHYCNSEMTTEEFGNWFNKHVLPEIKSFYKEK